MEKMRNALDPGRDKDARLMCGNGESDNITTGAHSSELQSSHLSGGNQGTGNASLDPRMATSEADRSASTASIKSGVQGNPEGFKMAGIGAAGTPGQYNSSGLANELDPDADSDLDERRGVEPSSGTGFLSSGGLTGNSYPDRTAGSEHGLATSTSDNSHIQAAHGPEAWVGAHQHLGLGHEYVGDPCPPESRKHTTITANLLDPHISGYNVTPETALAETFGGEQGPSATRGADVSGTSGTDYRATEPTSATSGTNPALPGTAATRETDTPTSTAAYGSGLGEAPDRYDSEAGPTSREIGASRSGQAVDPALVTAPGVLGATAARKQLASETVSSGPDGVEPSTVESKVAPDTRFGSHAGRDAAVAGGIGAAGYEAEKHHQHHGNQAPSDGDTAFGSQGGRDSALVGGIGAESYENYPRQPTTNQTETVADTGVESHKDRDAAMAGGLGTAGYEANKNHQYAAAQTDRDPDGLVGESGAGSHKGRDAALVGGAGAAAYEAEKHHRDDTADRNIQSAHTNEDQTSTSHYTAGTARPVVDKESEDHHYGRDAAVAGGAAAGADHEVSKHESKKEAKKEAKEEAKHEKHEKHAEKEKKHRGLFSFLHRDKNKKYTPEEEEEFNRQEREYNDTRGSSDTSRGPSTTTGAETTGREYKSDRNRLHKDPPGVNIPDVPLNGHTTQGVGRGTGQAEKSTVPLNGHTSEGVSGGTGQTGKSTVTEPNTGLPMKVDKGASTNTTNGAASGSRQGY